ncbi:MAG: transglycosylase SLT domain-containing protein [Bacteroidales bacterium]|nr:transglycosylase SLT domain-containing protein [Bacteroidales bacterium]MCF8458855.1 transglycosylase SLT domain-containing protein [Bacteroidales bacterium]
MGRTTCCEEKKAIGKKSLWGVLILVSVISITSLLVSSGSQPDDDKAYQSDFKNGYSVYALDLPDELIFAGEEVPLNDFYVREALDRELLVNTYYHSQTFLFIKKANRFFFVVEPILKEEGIPDDFKYLPFIESGYSNVTSPAGAVGYWQFMKGTAADYGLEVNTEIDERYHLEKSTRAACRFLKESFEKYGSWTLAAASYNVGRSRLSDELERQKTDGYYNLLLNEETARYVFRIMAVKLILENPENYGFKFRKKDLYEMLPVTQVKVDTAVSHFADFAANFSLSYKELKIYNPWLRNHFLTNKSGKTYFIDIPKK